MLKIANFIPIHILLLCLFSQSLPALRGDTPVSPYDSLTKKLLGKNAEEVKAIMKQDVPAFIDSYDTVAGKVLVDEKGGSRKYFRYKLNQETYLHVSCYKNSDTVEKCQIASLRDLVEMVPNNILESVRFIHQSPKPEPCRFDPVALIHAVNHFRRLEEKEAVRRIQIYRELAVREQRNLDWLYDLDEQRLFLILRLLFVRKDGQLQMPNMAIGGTRPEIPDNNKDWPLFPLVVQGDIPFFMAEGYALAGFPESPLHHIEYCEKNCTIRKSPLCPSLTPIDAVEKIYSSKQWKSLFTAPPNSDFDQATCKSNLREQAAMCYPKSLIKPVELSDDSFNPNCDGPEKADEAWNRFKKEMDNRLFTWDKEKEEFICKK